MLRGGATRAEAKSAGELFKESWFQGTRQWPRRSDIEQSLSAGGFDQQAPSFFLRVLGRFCRPNRKAKHAFGVTFERLHTHRFDDARHTFVARSSLKIG